MWRSHPSEEDSVSLREAQVVIAKEDFAGSLATHRHDLVL
jgi:hypothetical protein